MLRILQYSVKKDSNSGTDLVLLIFWETYSQQSRTFYLNGQETLMVIKINHTLERTYFSQLPTVIPQYWLASQVEEVIPLVGIRIGSIQHAEKPLNRNFFWIIISLFQDSYTSSSA